MSQQYTNELTPELAASMARPPFSAEKKAAMSEGAHQAVEEQEVFMREHPVVAIYRIAVDGALTRRGGVVRAVWNGSEIALEDGHKFYVALVGSRLSNGDVIISTPQAGCMLNELKGLPVDDDFLPAEG
ncbi:hypothetical protein [Enterobacter bugandensis]|uniref:hypothetical protein n=1 Tax=Enterobacter bugandensis TaxID=881260 RepID=UPI002005637C|nr:hypothetical protein [Enterobacter bugandensis]MCK6897731.1 hypothetical protein [Enterobacter bugandensis]